MLAAAFPMLGCAGSQAPAPKISDEVQQLLDPEYQKANACGGAIVDVPPKKPMPLIAGLAPVHYAVSTKMPEAQRYFDQGLALLYGFEYSKAQRSFAAARALDPACFMCAWGEAMAMGPNINSGPIGKEAIAGARLIVAKALAQPGIDDRERALLEALFMRYAPAPPKNENGVHAARYADTMSALSGRWPQDDVIAVLAAEAAMNVRPWDYWQAGGVTPLPWAGKAIALVEKVLARDPTQSEAIHLYIHLTEASAAPARAERYADRLGVLAPNSAHLVHMPSHTYYRLGRFKDSVTVNERAIVVDEGMAQALGEDPAYYGYFFHHASFILSAAEQIGDAETTLRIAAQIERGIPVSRAIDLDRMQMGLAFILQTRTQFMSPAEILALPAPDARLKLLRPLWFAARAEAFARQGERASALGALQAMRRARAIGDDYYAQFAGMTEQMAYGRVARAMGNRASSISHFRKAAAIEAKFGYDEPPPAHQPANVALGAVLLEAGDAAGARAAFAQALTQRPDNGWALWGRSQAEVALGDAAASRTTLAALDKVWVGDRKMLDLKRY